MSFLVMRKAQTLERFEHAKHGCWLAEYRMTVALIVASGWVLQSEFVIGYLLVRVVVGSDGV